MNKGLISLVIGCVLIILLGISGYFYIRYGEIPYVYKKKRLQDSSHVSILPDSNSFRIKNSSISGIETTFTAKTKQTVVSSDSSSLKVSSGTGQLAGEQTNFSPQSSQQEMSSKEKRKLKELYESMKPAKVAEILEMTKDDNKVREVIMLLNHRSAGRILQLLPPERVQKILGLKEVQ